MWSKTSVKEKMGLSAVRGGGGRRRNTVRAEKV